MAWLAKEGLPCTGTVEHVDGPLIATSALDCGDTLALAVYATHADAVRGFEALDGIGTPIYMAIGTNWTVNGDEAYVRLAAQRLGGDFRKG